MPVPVENPATYVDGFLFDLYCKYEHEDWSSPPAFEQFEGFTARNARAQIRKRGWVLHRDRTATCPECAKALGLR